MAIATKYFRYSFGEEVPDNVEAVPDGLQMDGTVSYYAGYGDGYSIPPGTSGSINIEREKYNGLINDITTFAQQIQQNGIPNFIESSQNGGVPFGYSMYAQVLYEGVVYRSFIDDNTDTPPSVNWARIDQFGQSLILSNATFDDSVASGDVVYFDGTNFNQALANGGDENDAVGIANVSTGQVVLSGVRVGGPVTAGSTYYLSASVAGAQTTVAPYPYVTQIAVGYGTNTRLINIQAVTTVQNYIPPGTTMFFAFPAGLSGAYPVPDGWLLCGETQYSRIVYARLFSAIGTYWGVGNGTTTFNIPPAGYFIRPWNNTDSGIDPSREFGWDGRQTDEYGSHNHGLASSDITSAESGYFLGNQQSGLAGSAMARTSGGTPEQNATAYYDIDTVQGKLVQLTGGDETRPANVAMALCIKY